MIWKASTLDKTNPKKEVCALEGTKNKIINAMIIVKLQPNRNLNQPQDVSEEEKTIRQIFQSTLKVVQNH